MQNTIPTQDRIANKIEIDALLIPSPEEKSLMKATQASNQIHYGNKPHRSVISFARMRVKDMLEG